MTVLDAIAHAVPASPNYAVSVLLILGAGWGWWRLADWRANR